MKLLKVYRDFKEDIKKIVEEDYIDYSLCKSLTIQKEEYETIELLNPVYINFDCIYMFEIKTIKDLEITIIIDKNKQKFYSYKKIEKILNLNESEMNKLNS